jgi:pilus assembly protein CpaD
MIMSKFFSNRKSLRTTAHGSLALIAAIGLTGCAIAPSALDDSYVPMNGSEKYPIEVAKGPVTLEVSSKHGTLQPNQINAVSAFARSAMGNGFTGLTLRRPAGGGQSARVASEVASLIQQMGMPASKIHMATYPAGGSSPVQISYVRTYAKTKECGNWDENLADTGSNDSMLNHGCTVQANIAAMVINPEVFVVPAPETPAMAASRMTAITTMNAGGTGIAASKSIASPSPSN